MAKHYAIMRGEKRKSGDIGLCVRHITRRQKTSNANSAKHASNYALVGPKKWNDLSGINRAIQARTPDKYRKDAVRAIEFIVTASPDWFVENPDQERAYFESAIDFFKQEYGDKNVVSAVVHKDESNPHMHLLVVPLDEHTGRLNAKWAFGNMGVMQKRQTRFAKHMAPFGVERGRANSSAEHTRIQDWYQGQADLDARQSAIDEQQKHVSDEKLKLQDQQQDLSREQAELSKRKTVVSQREDEIRQARADLQQRSDALTAAADRFEQQKAEWIAANRPPDVPPTVQHLRELLDLGRIDRAERLDELDAEGIYLYDYCDAEGLTHQGQDLLQQHSGAIEQQQRFDEIFTQQLGPSGPSL